ncbi:MAG TPA: SDR family NAD(P)-dependent oxidoreductase [Bacteroidales bacterium]|jgi:NADP-dependent 3-hydroxy acid dehydrogenase YdfG|nr:SDR family NAD(P)-dependent oxidoreductase [Bacteroidales bacterium]
MRKIALVTGASAGIGRAAAQKLAENKYNIIITGRRLKQLEDLKNELGIKYKSDVYILNFDITNQEETSNAIDSLPEAWKKIDVLVNNAGLSVGLNHIQDGIIEDWERMIDTNIKGLLYISNKVMPLMIARSSGHIVNITSIAGKEVYESGNVYCATKSAADAITKGMRIDLLKHNIKVTSIAPGMVETEFSIVRFKGDKERAGQVYKGLVPLSGDDVADAIIYAVTRPAHVNINDMLIMPVAQASATYVNRTNN